MPYNPTTTQFQNVFSLSNVDVMLLALFTFGVLSFFAVRLFGARGSDALEAPALGTEAAYESLPVAWPTILIVWSLAAFVLGRVYSILPGEMAIKLAQEVESNRQKMLFLVYLVGFGSMWVVYFLSASNNFFFKVRSLRRLLMTFSVHWLTEHKRISSATDTDVHRKETQLLGLKDSQEKKAASSIASIALLIAAAAVVIGLINDTSLVAANDDDKVWIGFMLGLAATSAITAFYCFIVAADVLETVFNRFEPESLRLKLTDRLYKYAINPKYYGLIFLMLSVAFFAAAREPALGALALAVATFIGYGHWFPRLNPRQGLEKLEWLMRISIVAVPALITLNAI